MSERDQGSVLVLVVFVAVAFTGAAGAGLAALSRDLVDVTRARSAADAAALASVEGGLAAAVELAAVNGAEIVSWAQVGTDVVVEVRVGDAIARARATNVP
jgi:tartrate dehydratase beta subunit/fumarate hydratase class I family protein